ncbi:MAG: HAD family hydrolase [Kiritimatiellae bacterium]|nr:HAD family hydrolase [Kiritimatiellia bacterium]
MFKLSPTPSIRLVSLDFDGTIMVYDQSVGRFHPEVVRVLNALADQGIAWCANSGRDLEDQKVVLHRSREVGLTHMPQAIISSESLVHFRDGEDYLPLISWNEKAMAGLKRLHRAVHEALAPHRKNIEETYQPDLILWDDAITAFLVKDRSGTKPRALFNQLMDWLADVPSAVMSMNGAWVQVMLRGLGKGIALSAWTETVGLLPDEILAVGDHYNDLDMLSGRHASHIGCPLDALMEVRLTVERARGYVGRYPGPLGTVDILERAIGLSDRSLEASEERPDFPGAIDSV